MPATAPSGGGHGAKERKNEMSNGENPYGEAGGYTTNLQYGEAERPAQAGSPQGSQAAGQAGGFSLDAPAGAPAGQLIKDTTTANFAADVIQESQRQPVLVDFWAPWCGPCRQLGPALEKVVTEAGGRVKLVKMNIDEHPSVAGQLGIQSIPAVIAFVGGQPVDGFMGAVPERQIREFIDKLAGDGGAGEQLAELIEAAQAARASGDDDTAARYFAAVLQQDPANAEAIGGLADLMFDKGDKEAATEMLAQVPADKQDVPAVAAVRAKMKLAEEAASLGDPVELERRLAANPKDHQARFDLALVQNARGMRMEAADSLLAIMKAERGWNDDAARSQLLKFFEAWGPADEVTLSARRKLSSLLFS